MAAIIKASATIIHYNNRGTGREMDYAKERLIKSTLMQIWKSANIFVFIWKYVENLTLKHLLLFEICAQKIGEKFVYKHSETIENVKN